MAINAPITPSGTASMTDTGTLQLSYSAARHRNTNRMDTAYSRGACEPDWRSCSDAPVHSKPMPGGILAMMASTAAMASPELAPGAVPASISSAGLPL